MKQFCFLSKNEKCFTTIDGIRIRDNDAREGRNKAPSSFYMIQYEPFKKDREDR
jgi:hypothetical protein